MSEEITITPKVESVSTTDKLPSVQDDTSSVANYLGISDPSSEAQSKIDAIAKYLRGDKKEYTDIDMLTDLKGTMFKLGNPPIGTSQLDFLYNYAKLDAQIDVLQKQKEEYIR